METKTENRNQSLTKAELHLMNILWDKGKATVQQLHDVLAEPKPAYTTTLTVMQILTKKGVVGFEKNGKANVYHPLAFPFFSNPTTPFFVRICITVSVVV